jgi:Tfp pilus assembly protein PilV
MVAVCLMAIGVVPLLVTHASTIRAFTRSKEITQASFIASSQIGILESQDREKEEVPEPGEGQDESYPFIHWKSAVSSSEGDALARADVTVQIAPEGVTGQGNAAALSTYLVKLRFKEEEEEKK